MLALSSTEPSCGPAIRGCIPRWIGRYGSADALKLALLRSTRNGFHCRWHSPSSMPSSPTCEERCYSSVVLDGPRLPVFGVTTTFSVISWRVVSDGSVLRAFATGSAILTLGAWPKGNMGAARGLQIHLLRLLARVVRDILYLATFRTLSLRDLLSGIYASVVADELWLEWLESNGRIVNALGSAYASWTAS